MKKDGPKIVVLGLAGSSVFMSVDHFHGPGETLKAGGLYTEPGGKARRTGELHLLYGAR